MSLLYSVKCNITHNVEETWTFSESSKASEESNEHNSHTNEQENYGYCEGARV